MKATVIKIGLVLAVLFSVSTFSSHAVSDLPGYFLDTKVENGKAVSISRYNFDGYTKTYSKSNTVEYVYDEQDRLIEVKRYRWDYNGTEEVPVFQITYQYDVMGNVSELALSLWDKKNKCFGEPLEKLEYAYNGSGILAIMNYYKKENNEWKVSELIKDNLFDNYLTEVQIK